jgi:hypothetical protein
MDSIMEFLGWTVFYYFIFKMAQTFAQSLIDNKEQRYAAVKQYLDRIIHQVEVEVVNGVTYWFDRDNNAFLAQGQTNEDIIAVIKQRFPDHIFLLPTEEVVTANTDWKLVKFDGFHEVKYTIKEIP